MSFYLNIFVSDGLFSVSGESVGSRDMEFVFRQELGIWSVSRLRKILGICLILGAEGCFIQISYWSLSMLMLTFWSVSSRL